ncbi:UNVERIFIED_ORG: hypothetical protein ABID57_002140 [Arthrobacter sp. UYEF1]
MELTTDPDEYRSLVGIRRAACHAGDFDPLNILNPGKVFLPHVQEGANEPDTGSSTGTSTVQESVGPK